MKRIISSLLIIAMACILLASCADSTLYGTWSYESESGVVSYTFTKDGNVQITTTYADRTDTIDMTYKAKDGVITLIDGNSQKEVNYRFENGALILDEYMMLDKQ